MNKKVLLIDEEQVKASSTIEKNVDSKILARCIVDTQEIQLRQVLGKDLYNTVIDAVFSASTDITYVMDDDTKELLDDYITPYLTYAVVVDFITTNNYKLTNKGVLKLNDGNATSLSNADLDMWVQYYQNKLSAYKQILIDYITENEVTDDSSSVNINTTSLSTGWLIEQPTYDYSYYDYLRYRN